MKKLLSDPTDYQAFRTILFSFAEDEYRDFAKAGTPTDYPFLGVRLPILRELAKEIVQAGAAEDFLTNTPGSFEEQMVQGIVIASLPYERMLTYFDNFVVQIDNWGTCDTFCNTLKSVRAHREDFLPKINELLDGSEFQVRVALVILLCHYLQAPKNNAFEEHVSRRGKYEATEAHDDGPEGAFLKSIVFGAVDRVVNREEYYIRMAIAWLLAECFIKFPDPTWDYLADNNLPKRTQNKTISKIRDSFRVDQATKDALLTLRK